MLLLRLFFILMALLLAISGGMYLFTRDPRYLRFAGQVVRFTLFTVLLTLLLYVLERFVLVGWRVFL